MSVASDFLRRPRTVAAVLGLCYLATGWLWIGFSDQVGSALFTSAEALTRFQTYKGLAFVAVSAALLYAGMALGRPEPREPLPLAGRRSLSVRTLLTVLVLATGLPMAALLGWNIWRDTRGQVDEASRLIRGVAEDESMEVLQFLQGQQRMAAAVAQRGLVRRLDPAACDPLLMGLPLIDPDVREIATFNAAGQVVCGSHIRAAAAGPPDWLPRLLASGLPTLGHPASEAGVWTFSIVHPILSGEGRPIGAVLITLPVALLDRMLEGPMPGGGTISLLDDHGHLIGRSPPSPQHIGTLVPAPAGGPDRGREAGSFDGPGLDGVERLFASHPVGATGWAVVAGVPVDSVYGPARQAFLRSALLALAVLTLCGWLVLPLSRRIVAPLRALERTAQKVAAGRFQERAPESGPVELAAVAAGFNHMLDRLPALQRELRESEERRQTLAAKLSSNVPGMIYQASVDQNGHGCFPFVSERIRDMFELEPAQVATDGRPLMERIHPEDRPRVMATMEAAGRNLSFTATEYRVLLPRQGLRHYLNQAQPEARPGGGMLWYGCTVDITPLQAAQQALQDINQSLEQRIATRTAALASANEALEAFTYSVAHDLRAPLQVIDGFSRVLARAMREGDLDRAHSYNERVIANATRMNALIEGFLALSRASREPLQESPVDVGAMVRELLAEQPEAARAEVQVDRLPRVTADAATLRQVWFNLISNAFKYSAGRERPSIEIGCAQEGGELVFHVRDNGAGFDPAYAGKLFSPFHRLHRADEFEGTGVGLALVRRIVEGHGGRVWADARPDAGATFFFTLPRGRLIDED